MVNKCKLFPYVSIARSDCGKLKVGNKFVIVIKNNSCIVAVNLYKGALATRSYDD